MVYIPCGRKPTIPNTKQQKEPIWSLVVGARNWYLGFFAVFYLTAMVFVVAREIDAKDGTIETGYSIIVALGPAAMACAASAFTLTEIGRNGMVLAYSLQKWLEDRRRKRLETARARARQEGREEGRVQGREEGREEGETRIREWMEWNARRQTAEAHGETFTEPPPNS